MSDLLGISSNAVMAYQRALGTVNPRIVHRLTEAFCKAIWMGMPSRLPMLRSWVLMWVMAGL
jgi:hypothetical protein